MLIRNDINDFFYDEVVVFLRSCLSIWFKEKGGNAHHRVPEAHGDVFKCPAKMISLE